MLQAMPGSPFNDEKITQVQRAALEAKYGLDKPLYIQYFNYVKSMLRGDFGVSYVIQKNMPISELLNFVPQHGSVCGESSLNTLNRYRSSWAESTVRHQL